MYVRDFRFRKPKFLGGRVTLQSPGMSMKKLCNFKYILEITKLFHTHTG